MNDTCTCGHEKGEHVKERHECAAVVLNGGEEEPCRCIMFEPEAPSEGAG